MHISIKKNPKTTNKQKTVLIMSLGSKHDQDLHPPSNSLIPVKLLIKIFLLYLQALFKLLLISIISDFIFIWFIFYFYCLNI